MTTGAFRHSRHEDVGCTGPGRHRARQSGCQSGKSPGRSVLRRVRCKGGISGSGEESIADALAGRSGHGSDPGLRPQVDATRWRRTGRCERVGHVAAADPAWNSGTVPPARDRERRQRVRVRRVALRRAPDRRRCARTGRRSVARPQVAHRQTGSRTGGGLLPRRLIHRAGLSFPGLRHGLPPPRRRCAGRVRATSAAAGAPARRSARPVRFP